MLYGTFWYQYKPESTYTTKIPLWSTYFFSKSNYRENTSKYIYLGSLIYILVLLPTSIIFLGFLKIISSIPFNYKNLSEAHFNKITYELSSLLLLIIYLFLTICAGYKFDAWSCFQSRLFFPAFSSIILLFNSGFDWIIKRYNKIQNIILITLICLFILFIGYFGVEIGYIIVKYI